ncbi:MAG: DNA topoisomerase-1 [Glaciecola sp.]|jgi:DNA topoisomerase-1
MSKTLVIVESPTKARTLKKYLGPDFIVESSVGHIRDLPANASEVPAKLKGEAWSRLGVNVEEDFQPLYIVRPDKKAKIKELKEALKQVDRLLLATDEDREGEAISWHLLEVLKPTIKVERMVFHEITKSAIMDAISNTREVDFNMVEAQESRRVIDRLYGYEISPTLWRKVRPKLSAGRVQSVAVRMLVDRERARMRFIGAEYWDLAAVFETAEGRSFDARLTTVDGVRVAVGKDFDPDSGKLVGKREVVHLDKGTSELLKKSLATGDFQVISAEEKPFTKKPAAPFTTSTLQQEGGRKLRFEAKRTMRAAQRLYENGFITYMRTDSVVLSQSAIDLARDAVTDLYGAEYLPETPRTYKGKVKNAQEAHEAIRPAGDEVATVDAVRLKLGVDEAKLYELIRMRTLASQMKDAKGRRMVLKVAAQDGTRQIVFQASGSVIDFPGFLRAYVEGDDSSDALGSDETVLPPLEKGDKVKAKELNCEEHHTSPPARLTEASLVKALEESGIGRPSTYASIIDTIQNRNYSFKKGTALVPTFTAFAVTALLEQHFTTLIDPAFTARMEEQLDAIARGEGGRLEYLRSFYHGNGNPGLKPLVENSIEVIDARTICTIPLGQNAEGHNVEVRVGRYGPFLSCEEDSAPLAEDVCPDEVDLAFAIERLEAKKRGADPVGQHPDTQEPVYVKTGRFGPYVQLGEGTDDERPKMVSLLKGMDPENLPFETALALLSLPRNLGNDAEGEEILAFNGRYGPYIKRGADTRSLTAEDNLLEIDLKRALELLAQEKPGRGGRKTATPIKTFDNVPELDGGQIKLMEGRYGPYVSDGEYNASLPKGAKAEELTVSMAIELLEERRAKGPAKGRKKVTKKKAAKKKTTKKATTKKAASKKTVTKKAVTKKATTKKPTSKKKATKKAAKKATTKKPAAEPEGDSK